MQEQNTGAERDRREMIALLNGGDKRELRAFMRVYSKQIHDRALEITHDATEARNATRRVLAEVAALAAKGQLKENIDAQLMALTDQICSEAMFLDGLVDEAMRAAPKETAAAHGEAQSGNILTVAAAQPGKESPGVDAPGVDAPGVDVHGADAQKADAPGVDAPGVDAPGMDAPKREPAPPAAPQARKDGGRPPREEKAPSPRAAQAVPDLFADDDSDLLISEDAAGGGRKARTASSVQPGNGRGSRSRAERDPDSAGPMLVISIILASILVVALVWILVVKLMADGMLPNFDFGFAQWFNAHVFELF